MAYFLHQTSPKFISKIRFNDNIRGLMDSFFSHVDLFRPGDHHATYLHTHSGIEILETAAALQSPGTADHLCIVWILYEYVM